MKEEKTKTLIGPLMRYHKIKKMLNGNKTCLKICVAYMKMLRDERWCKKKVERELNAFVA